MDKAQIINNVATTLKDTPSAQDIVKNSGDRDKRFHYLATHMVDKAIEKDALLVSENGAGIAILFRTNAKDDNFWKDLPKELKLVRKVTGIRNALRILKKQKYIKAQRPQDGDYLYCWFWGILPDTRGFGDETQTAKVMKDMMMDKADELQLPLYAETRKRKVVIVYRRYGFDMFHEWIQPDGEKMWFLKYEPVAGVPHK